MTDEAKREELEQRIQEGQARQQERTLSERASEAAESATEFAKAHPFATVAGAITVGVLIGAMTKPGRRLGARGAEFAGRAADIAMLYGLKALDAAENAARASGDRLEDFGDSLSDTARSARRELNYRAGNAGDTVRKAARSSTKSVSRTGRSIRDRIGV